MYTRIQNIQKIKVYFFLGAPPSISSSTINTPPAPDALGRNPNTLTFDRSNDILYIDAIYRTLGITANEARIQDVRQLILQYFDTLLQNRGFPHQNELQNFITYLSGPTTTNGLDLIKRILYTENNLSQLHIAFPDDITQAIRNMEDPRVEQMRQAFIQMNVAHEQYTTIHYPLYGGNHIVLSPRQITQLEKTLIAVAGLGEDEKLEDYYRGTFFDNQGTYNRKTVEDALYDLQNNSGYHDYFQRNKKRQSVFEEHFRQYMSQKLLIDAKTQLEKTKTIIFKNQRSQLELLYAQNTRQKTREMIGGPIETAYLSQTFRENPRLFARTDDPRLNAEITHRLRLIISYLFPHLSSINGLQARLIEYIMDRLAASDDLYSNPRNHLGNIKPSRIHSIQEGANAFRNMLQSTPLKNGTKMVAGTLNILVVDLLGKGLLKKVAGEGMLKKGLYGGSKWLDAQVGKAQDWAKKAPEKPGFFRTVASLPRRVLARGLLTIPRTATLTATGVTGLTSLLVNGILDASGGAWGILDNGIRERLSGVNPGLDGIFSALVWSVGGTLMAAGWGAEKIAEIVGNSMERAEQKRVFERLARERGIENSPQLVGNMLATMELANLERMLSSTTITPASNQTSQSNQGGVGGGNPPSSPNAGGPSNPSGGPSNPSGNPPSSPNAGGPSNPSGGPSNPSGGPSPSPSGGPSPSPSGSPSPSPSWSPSNPASPANPPPSPSGGPSNPSSPSGGPSPSPSGGPSNPSSPSGGPSPSPSGGPSPSPSGGPSNPSSPSGGPSNPSSPPTPNAGGGSPTPSQSNSNSGTPPANTENSPEPPSTNTKNNSTELAKLFEHIETVTGDLETEKKNLSDYYEELTTVSFTPDKNVRMGREVAPFIDTAVIGEKTLKAFIKLNHSLNTLAEEIIPALGKYNLSGTQRDFIRSLETEIELYRKKYLPELQRLYPKDAPPQGHTLPTGDKLLKSDIWEILDPDNSLEYMIELIRGILPQNPPPLTGENRQNPSPTPPGNPENQENSRENPPPAPSQNVPNQDPRIVTDFDNPPGNIIHLTSYRHLTNKLANIGLGGIAILVCHAKLTSRHKILQNTQSAEIIQDIVTAYPKLLSEIREGLLSIQTNIKELGPPITIQSPQYQLNRRRQDMINTLEAHVIALLRKIEDYEKNVNGWNNALPTGDELLHSDIWEILDPNDGLDSIIRLIKQITQRNP